MKPNWEEILKDRLQLYGHRNWLVIADSAYPAQSRPAIETVVADEEQTTVLERTSAILAGCKHIKPIIYTDEELAFVHEEDAPGISSYREKLGILFAGAEVRVLPHEEIIAKLDQTCNQEGIALLWLILLAMAASVAGLYIVGYLANSLLG